MNFTISKAQQIEVFGLCLLVVSCLGCASEMDPNQAVAMANDSNIKRLSNLYLAFQMKNNWKGPEDEAKFKSFLNKLSPTKLSRIGVESGSIDGLFISERDGEPFKIRYSVPGSAMGCSEPVVFEASGVNGKRMVGFLNMQVRDVEEAEYNELWEGKVSDAPLRRE